MEDKNKKIVRNDSDKKMGAAAADKEDAIKESKRQLYDINTYLRLSWEEAEMLTSKIRMELLEVVIKYFFEKRI